MERPKSLVGTIYKKHNNGTIAKAIENGSHSTANGASPKGGVEVPVVTAKGEGTTEARADLALSEVAGMS